MKAKKITLKNGLRLITIPLQDASTVAVYVMAEVGAKYEDKALSGISHFLEHVSFKGTVRRPTAYHINSELDAIGAQTNAFTWYEFIGYHAKAHHKHIAKLVDILSDIYIHSVFPVEEIEKEKGVILEEINMYNDLPHKKVHELFSELVYGDQPVGRPVIGNRKSVTAITREDLEAYRDRAYRAEGTIVIIAGKFSPSSVRALVEKAFRPIPKGRKPKKAKVKTEQTRPALSLLPRPSEQTHLVLGFRAFGARHKDAPALSVLTALLGEGMSSRLFQKLREELGICYYVRASFDEYTDHGTFTVSAGVDPARSLEAISAILHVLKTIREEGVSEEELKKAKEYMVGNMYLGLETADSLAGYYGFDEVIRGSLKNPSEVEKEIRTVTAKDVIRLARNIFSDKGLNLAMVGKLPQKAEIKAILKIGA